MEFRIFFASLGPLLEKNVLKSSDISAAPDHWHFRLAVVRCKQDLDFVLQYTHYLKEGGGMRIDLVLPPLFFVAVGDHTCIVIRTLEPKI